MSFLSFASDTYLLSRYLEGEFIDGQYVAGEREEIEFEASIQPLNAFEIKNLPSGLENRDAVKIYSQLRLRTGNEGDTGIQPDRIEYDDMTYEVRSVQRWNQYDGLVFFKSVAFLVDD